MMSSPLQFSLAIEPKLLHGGADGRRRWATSAFSPDQLHTSAPVRVLHWLISVPQRISRQLAFSLCNHLEHLIPPTPLSLQIAHLGNFAPVSQECPPQACSLDERYGPLPLYLDGTYVRNGPNQQFASSSSCHPFDGDGMLHTVTFRPGASPTYCRRYVHTSRFLQEQAAQQALFTKTFSSLTSTSLFLATAHMSLAVLRHMLGLVDLTQGMGLANTGLVYHHGKLLALGEDDLPYALDIQDDGDLVNRGRYLFKGSYKPRTMTSHPKVDRQTGEMIFLSYSIFFRPYLKLFKVSSDGTISWIVPIDLKQPCMIHDFAITPNFIIFPETQLVFHPIDMLQGKAPIKCDPNKIQRFGVLRRDAQVGNSAIQWFEAPGCNCFHIMNAWEEASEEIVLMFPNLSNVDEMIKGNIHKLRNKLTEVRLDMQNGQAMPRPLFEDDHSDINVEMGTMNEYYLGVKNRFVYMGLIGSSMHSFKGVVKIDLRSRKVVAQRMFDKSYFASEPMFVPKASFQAYRELEEVEEDEGCLLCFLHHDNSIVNDDNDTSCQMLVLDTQSPTLEVIACIKLPQRVPYGFHGLFLFHKANQKF